MLQTAKACPSALPVDELIQITSVECTRCTACVVDCPAEGALALSLPRKREVPGWAMAAAVWVILVSCVGDAKYMGYWDTHLPESVYLELVPKAHELSQP